MMQTYTDGHIEDINNVDENGLDSMNREDILSRSTELLKIISDAEKELSEVRSNCRHKERTVKSVSIRDASALRIICEDCQMIVGYPSTKQINEWNEK